MKTKPGTVLHSSLAPFINSSSNFPRADRRIGVIAREAIHHPPGPCTVEVEWEGPSFVSTCAGEYVDPDDVDGVVRKKLLELARDCRTVAKELIEHAYRLEQIVGQETVIVEGGNREEERREGGGVVTAYENRGPEKIEFRRSAPTSSPLPPSKGKEVDVDEL